ncbi:MAG: hypothetical protein ACYTXA_09070 [Nostoc sp.]
MSVATHYGKDSLQYIQAGGSHARNYHAVRATPNPHLRVQLPS